MNKEELKLLAEIRRQQKLLDKRIARLETLEFTSYVGGWEEIETITADAAIGIITFSDIPQIFLHLALILSVRSHNVTGSGNMQMTFNDDDAANYWYNKHWFYGDTGACLHRCISLFGTAEFANYIDLGDFPGLSFGGGAMYEDLFCSQNLWIPDYRCDEKKKSCHWDNEYVEAPGDEIGPYKYRQAGGGYWHDTDAITKIDILAPGAATFAQNSKISLYGIGGTFECH